MRYIRLLLLCQFMMFATQAMAAQTGRDCESKAKQIAPGKRDAFIQTCLAQTSSPANVQEVTQQNKRRTCDQNAKNLKLTQGSQPGYVDECLHKNDAAIAAKRLHAPQPVRLASSSADKPAKSSKISCTQQAKEQSLKGSKRRQFMKACRDN